MSSSGNKLSDHPVIIILGVISACIAIFAFCTGIQSITQIFGKLTQGSGNSPSSNPFTPIPSAEPTAAEIVAGNWVQVGLPGDTISDVKIVNENLMYASTLGFQHGIFKSDDGGKNWRAINNGLGNLDIYEMSLMNGDQNILIAGSDSGIWATKNGGQIWQPLASASADQHSVLAQLSILSVSTTSSSIYIVGTANYGGYVTRDFGNNWLDLRDVAYQATKDDIFWNVSLQHSTTSQNPSPTIYLTGYDNLYRSTDDGTTWIRIAHVGANYNVADIVADPTNASIVYSCTGNRDYSYQSITFDKGYGLYISTDSGGSWLPINNGLPNQGNETECTKVALDSSNTQRVYVAVNGQVYVSENKGENWKQLAVLPDKLGSVTAMAVYGQKICIGTNQNGVWCTLR
jgi:photosystem II stability/assembly factor-like uncharacterized protein